MSRCVTITVVPKADHSRNSSSFSNSKYFVCSTCQKSVFNANHDAYVTKFLNEVNSRAKVPTGKIFKSSTTKVDSEPLNGLNEDITNPYECEQTIDSWKVSGENQLVLKSSVVTAVDASNKRQQQQPDSTLSTSTLAKTVTADGNFDLCPQFDQTATNEAQMIEEMIGRD
ncbi:hypothetical protein Tco_0791694 [Tanacetum coccineum]